jgi:colanic acid biosynthesis glycosyl transferase WcaI
VRILLLTQLFEPEPNFLKGVRFARFLQERGHSVEVLTSFPNYPGGRLYPGYRLRAFQRESVGGVDVLRVPHYPSHDNSAVRRILSYCSFAASAALIGTSRVQPPDVIHVYQGPATLMLAGRTIARLRGGRVVLDIQDLWPDSVTGSGMIRSPRLARILDAFCRWTYARANRIVVLSQAYKDRLVGLGVPTEKVDVVYNWCDEASLLPPVAELDDSTRNVLPPGHFHVVYAGSLGPLQDLGPVIDAAHLLSTHPAGIRLTLVGNGIEAASLRDHAWSAGVSNVTFVPRQDQQSAAAILKRADVLLVHLKDHPLSRGAIPQKVQAYLAAGRPIVIGANGEAADLVEHAGGGVRCRPGDVSDIARAIAQLAALSETERQTMGSRGAEYYRTHLSFDRGSWKMERLFERVACEAVA